MADPPPPAPHPNGEQAMEAEQALEKALAALAEAGSALFAVSRAAS